MTVLFQISVISRLHCTIILRYSCEIIFEETIKNKEALFNFAYLKQITLAL